MAKNTLISHVVGGGTDTAPFLPIFLQFVFFIYFFTLKIFLSRDLFIY